MELLIEFLVELILEGSMEISEDEKMPKWLRYICLTIVTLFFGTVTIGLFILGVYVGKENIYAGIFFILIAFILLISGIIKFEKKYIEKRNLINND